MIALLLLHAQHALAADVDPFRPAGSLATGVGTLQGESPWVLGDGFQAGLLASFAQNLAVDADGGPEVAVAAPVEVFGAYVLPGQNARVEVFAPIYGWVDAPVTGYAAPAFGDLRFQLNAAIVRGERFRVAVIPRVELPTGSRRAAMRRGFQVGVTAAAGGRVDRLGWVANLGVQIAETSQFPNPQGIGLGSSADGLLGAFWTVDERGGGAFRVGLELDGKLGLVKGPAGGHALAQGHVFAQNLLPSGVGLTVGAGTGFTRTVGAPDYRVFGALTWAQLRRDADRDGIPDREDLCPNDPEDHDGFQDADGCPDPDNDGDGILDGDDQCPNDPEDHDGFQDADGCPDPDNDGDGLLDLDDRCPDQPGPAALQGCPDRDGDGVADAQDACPDQPGLPAFDGCPDRDGDQVPDPRDRCPDQPIPPDEDPATSDGCPKVVYVSQGRITITQQVMFETGKATIRGISHGLLDQVAAVFQAHPHLREVEVAGHTDNVGSERYNLKLSQERAAAVRAYLIRQGVAPERMVSRGYGEGKPTDTNRTDAGRANNRRVEFVILKQDPRATPTPAPEALKDPWGPVPTPEPLPAPVPGPVPKPAPAPAPAPATPAPAPATPAPHDLHDPWGDAPASPTPAPTTRQPEPEPEPRAKRPPRRSKKR